MAFSTIALVSGLLSSAYLFWLALILVAASYVAVFITDDLQGRTPIAHAVEVLNRGVEVMKGISE